ncbi:chorismate mutase [Trinickia dinghuensis]|uniref:Chorismate mutase n=1 Tax=Trinickia dinghuensis TaxID=2291023 RepID=A0A3D8JRP4_9BURK|nr:chorismate mutase [Trinickia dinghuensis]RDU95688.1 chorismate mutase [Trinickia dinghuensis]
MTPRVRRSALPAVALCLALSLASVGARADGDETAMTNLVALVSQRLALALPVAQWKWANHRPITDAPREAQLLADVAHRAQAADVDPAYAHAFFQDQMEASKQIQTALFERWRTSAPPSGAIPDLATSTRPQLDRVTHALIRALARVQPSRDADDCPARLAQSVANWKALTRYGAIDAQALNTALAHVCKAGGVGGEG